MPSVIDKLPEIDEWLKTAEGIAWDTCHKIYILMDRQEVNQMRGYGYDPLITSDEMTPEEMLGKVLGWYRESCGLRFISVTKTADTGDTEFYDVVPQLYEGDDE